MSKREAFMRENATLLERHSYAELNYLIHISLRYRYVFVETPKAGCSTVKFLLQCAEVNSPGLSIGIKDLHRRQFSPLLQPSQIPSLHGILHSASFLKFCFVRQPQTRFLACYLDKIGAVSANKKRVAEVRASLDDSDGSRERKVAFGEFARVVCRQSVDEMDIHWRPQTTLLTPNIIPYDVVGRAENLAADLREICKQLGISFERFYRERREHGTEANVRVSKYYREDTCLITEKIYGEDFTNFDYDPIELKQG